MAIPVDAKIPPVILFTSCASLAYEVTLTRIFSISLWYHYAFMIISIAMLGYAASGTALALFPRLKEARRIGRYAILLGLAIPASYLLANRVPFDPVRLNWERAQLLYLGLYYLILAVPFFCAGLVVATAFSVASGRSGLFYGADLLGAGAGSLGVLFLMYAAPPERVVFVLSALALAAGCLLIEDRPRMVVLALIVVDLFLFVRPPAWVSLRISPYKGLEAALLYPGARHLKTYDTPFARIDTFTSPGIRFAPGLSLRYLEPLPPQVGIAIDAGDSSTITAADNRSALDFLGDLPAALPYAMGKREKALILDPRGGLQALVAEHFDAGETFKVETNPDLVAIVQHDWREFSGNIYGSRTFTGLGRSWLAGRKERFDVIDLSLQGTEPSGAFGIAEDYRLTVDAFKEYLGHLQPDGVLSVNLYIIPPPRLEFRLLATAVAAMEEMGVKEPARHLAAIRSWGTLCLLVKKSPLTPADVANIKKFALERWFDPVYFPGISTAETGRFVRMAGSDYADAFTRILAPGRRQQFMADYLFDIAPVRDDAPFAHYSLRLGHIRAIYRAMGEKWQFFLEEGYILPALLLQVKVLGALLLLAPALKAGTRDSGLGTGKITFKSGRRLLPYFALLGLGFMFVETALIQKLILPLETPSYAMAALLATLLIASGAGSLIGYRFPGLEKAHPPLLIAFLVSVYSFLLPAVLPAVATHALPVKVILAFLLFFPLGLFMGIPFPTGLRTLGEVNPHLIPWAWAINGTLSVLAPILAVMLAMAAGFRVVLLAGALAYLLAFLNLKLGTRTQTAGLKDSGLGTGERHLEKWTGKRANSETHHM